jgi:hypothetical protein
MKPHQQAEYMTAPDQAPKQNKLLAERGPSLHDGEGGVPFTRRLIVHALAYPSGASGVAVTSAAWGLDDEGVAGGEFGAVGAGQSFA